MPRCRCAGTGRLAQRWRPPRRRAALLALSLSASRFAWPLQAHRTSTKCAAAHAVCAQAYLRDLLLQRLRPKGGSQGRSARGGAWAQLRESARLRDPPPLRCSGRPYAVIGARTRDGAHKGEGVGGVGPQDGLQRPTHRPAGPQGGRGGPRGDSRLDALVGSFAVFWVFGELSGLSAFL